VTPYETLGELRLAMEVATGRAPRKLAVVNNDSQKGQRPMIEVEVHQTSVKEIAQVATAMARILEFLRIHPDKAAPEDDDDLPIDAAWEDVERETRPDPMALRMIEQMKKKP
jgi:hypothetical protein